MNGLASNMCEIDYRYFFVTAKKVSLQFEINL